MRHSPETSVPAARVYATRPSTVERAFHLAATGLYPKVSALAEQLVREGYFDARAHFSSRALSRQLRQIIAGAIPSRGPEPGNDTMAAAE
ncbi:MAG: hypothetical protein SGJ21_06015 [Alphaproteobacteria bacterium]|nr:hypothetical protein [Alphaproteobacteria bacterium]